MNHIYLNLTLPIYHPLPLPCFYPRYLICLGLLKFSGVSPLIFFLHLLNFHLVALEENQQCIPKNKREKQCFKKRRYTMQLVTCLLRKYERVCKVKNHCKLESSTCLFFTLPHFYTLPIIQMTCMRERVSWEKTSIVVVYISVLSCRLSDWLRHGFEPITLLNRLKSFHHPAIFRASHSQLEIKNEGVFFLLQPLYGLLMEHWRT